MFRRLGGELIALNPDLIERVEATPDTVVTMLDDKKFLVAESLEEVLDLITDYRAYVIARANDLSLTDHGGRPVLHVVPNELIATSEVAELEGPITTADQLDGTNRNVDGDEHDPDGVHLEFEPEPDGRVHLEFRSSRIGRLRQQLRPSSSAAVPGDSANDGAASRAGDGAVDESIPGTVDRDQWNDDADSRRGGLGFGGRN